jgi:hypothetical protein
MRLLPLAAVLLTACALDEAAFADAYAEAWCARAKACDEGAYWDRFDDGTATCRPDRADAVNDKSFGNGQVACRYDEDAARACLDTVDRASCDALLDDDFLDDCADAWDCVTVTRTAPEP